MPLFHFNSCAGGEVLHDVEGEELPDIAAALKVAETAARETLIEAVKNGETPPDCIQITDAGGREVGIVPLEDLLDKPERQ